VGWKTGEPGFDTQWGQIFFYVGFEVLTAVVMKNTIFWDITPCSPLKVNRRFGGTLPSSGSKNKPSKRPVLPATCFHAGLYTAIFVLATAHRF
jgi:hypothetical protein